MTRVPDPSEPRTPVETWGTDVTRERTTDSLDDGWKAVGT